MVGQLGRWFGWLTANSDSAEAQEVLESSAAALAPVAAAPEPLPSVVSLARAPTCVTTRAPAKAATTIYVSEGVRRRFDDYRRRNRMTNRQVVLGSITSKHGQLADIIEASAVGTAPRAGSLFPFDPAAVRYLGGGSIPIVFTATIDQRSVLDALGEQLGFSTRSTWIAPVLNVFLPGRKDS